jgi:hypothetical protein
MTEPTTFSAATIAAGVSSITLAALGVDYYSLIYGFIGALFAILHVTDAVMTKGRAITYVALSTMVGAVLGNAALAMFGTSNKFILFFGCLIGGAGAQLLVAAALKAAVSRIESWGVNK